MSVVFMSPPSRGRGLKHKHKEIYHRHKESPPSRGRGLKQTEYEAALDRIRTSPPSRGRGLKLPGSVNPVDGLRRPLRGGVD